MSALDHDEHVHQVEMTDRQEGSLTEPPSTTSLPRVDGGRAAWLFLAAAFMIETLLWGFPFSFGVLVTYYQTHPPLSLNPAGISSIGTTCSGLMYLASPIGLAAIQQSQFLRKYSTFVGLALIVVSILLSSFATKAWQLIITQGVLYALGGGALYYPTLLFVDEWFMRRKFLAYGIVWGGTGTGGVLGPLVLQWGLGKYGASTFLKGWAVALLVLIGPLLFFVRPRVPWSGPGRSENRLRLALPGFGFLKTRTFWILQAGNFAQGLGYFIPIIYLPDYAKALGLESIQQSAIVSVLNSATVPGTLTLAILSTHLDVTTVMLISAGGASLGVFLLWGLSSSATALPLLITFAAMYGFFAGGWSAVYPALSKEVQNACPEGTVSIGTVLGQAGMARGIGNVACGPLSELLLRRDGLMSKTIAYKSSYGGLVIFTGVTAICSLIPWITRKARCF